jgi:hypothetical protein
MADSSMLVSSADSVNAASVAYQARILTSLRDASLVVATLRVNSAFWFIHNFYKSYKFALKS